MDSRPICFYMDGVIIDSEPSHFDAFRLAFESVGISLDHDEYQTYFAGKTDAQGLHDFLQTVETDCTLAELHTAKQNHYQTFIGTNVRSYARTVETIKALHTIHPLAIVTSAPFSEVKIILQRLNLGSHFSVIVTSDDITQGKPDPEGYQLAAERLGVNPMECYVVEDSPSGITAAKRAGMYCVALTTTHELDELAEADTIVTELTPELFD